MTTVKCDVCGWKYSHLKPLVAQQRLGFHKRTDHGLRGITSRERYYIDKKGMTRAQAQAVIAELDGVKPFTEPKSATNPRREYQRQWREKRRAKLAQNNNKDAVPALLDRCCVCGARFYVVKGQE